MEGGGRGVAGVDKGMKMYLSKQEGCFVPLQTEEMVKETNPSTALL